MPPLLSVCMITYGHEKYISQAIESVLSQNTDFDFELVIGEDCSPDGTRAIVQRYAGLHPDKIRPLFHETNLGSKGNWIATLEACRGRYIASLEGDDFWTNSTKLQRQVTYLEANPDCALCGHDVEEVDEDGNCIADDRRLPPICIDGELKDIVVRNFVPTCSAVFVNKLPSPWPRWYVETLVGDWPLWIWMAQQGRVHCYKQKMGAYRIHSGGSWSQADATRMMSEQALKMFQGIDHELGGEFHSVLASHMLRHHRRLFENYWASRSIRKAMRHACQLIPLAIAARKHRRWRFKRALEVFFPGMESASNDRIER